MLVLFHFCKYWEYTKLIYYLKLFCHLESSATSMRDLIKQDETININKHRRSQEQN